MNEQKKKEENESTAEVSKDNLSESQKTPLKRLKKSKKRRRKKKKGQALLRMSQVSHWKKLKALKKRKLREKRLLRKI